MNTTTYYKEYEGMKFALREGSPSDEHVFNEMSIDDSYKLKDRKLSGTVFDIGCNTGMFSCLAAARGANKIVAFEPEPNNYEIAKHNIEINGFSDIVELHPFGLGAKAETVKMIPNHGGSVLSSIMGSEEGIDIRLEVLDDFLKDVEVSFLKMDIEGSEVFVVPNSRLFRTNVVEFAMEHHGINQKWFTMIASLVGYFNVTIESHAAPDHQYGGMMYGVNKNANR